MEDLGEGAKGIPKPVHRGGYFAFEGREQACLRVEQHQSALRAVLLERS